MFIKDCQVVEPAAFAVAEKIAEKLWKVSEEIVGQKLVW